MRLIKASEIGEYLYCHRAWWLHTQQGHPSANVRELETGTAAHTWHGRLVWLGSALRFITLLLFALAGIVLLLWWYGLSDLRGLF